MANPKHPLPPMDPDVLASVEAQIEFRDYTDEELEAEIEKGWFTFFVRRPPTVVRGDDGDAEGRLDSTPAS